MRKNFLCLMSIFIGVCTVLVSCVSTKNGSQASTHQQFVFNSSPEGAKVVYNGKVIGTTPFTAQIPVVDYAELLGLKQPSKLNSRGTLTFKFLKTGYKTQEVKIKPSWDVTKPFKFSQEGVFCEMERDPSYDATMPDSYSGEAVSRDNPGETDLEKTIIRWYFDSDPRGARVFWRVISSVPAEVKNTNETYLGTTPFEETRSFNILGLTYENSRDVQIEVKIAKRGYMEQVKRFNVRQAIDQQEISSFYELIPNE